MKSPAAMKAMPIRKFTHLLYLAILLFVTFLMFQLSVPYLSFKIDEAFLATKQSIIHISIWRWSFYIHVFTSVFTLLLGGLQFFKSFAYKYKKLHRSIGIAYVLLVAFFSGPSGLIMGWYASGGIAAQISFMTLSVLWIGFTVIAFIKARNKKIRQHQNYMLRSYLLTLSAVTLRTYTLLVPVLLHLRGKEAYIMIAWLSWVPNLLLAEILIKARKTSL